MQKSYLLFNKMIAAILAAIILYCVVLPLLGNYAVKCAVELATGHLCIGCGLTRGIHQALMFHFDKALKWNSSSLLVLSFLLITILVRIVTGILVSRNSDKKRLNFILYTDLTLSFFLYLFCFRHFFTTILLR
jgi:hypothetical protein